MAAICRLYFGARDDRGNTDGRSRGKKTLEKEGSHIAAAG